MRKAQWPMVRRERQSRVKRQAGFVRIRYMDDSAQSDFFRYLHRSIP